MSSISRWGGSILPGPVTSLGFGRISTGNLPLMSASTCLKSTVRYTAHRRGPPFRNPIAAVRKRLGALGPERSDLWWSVRSEKKTVAEVRLRLDRDAFPWFRRFETRDSLLQELEKAEETWGTGGPPRIICAILLAHRGQTEKTRENLILQARKRTDTKHTEHVQALADRLGLGRIDT
jgi:hypothetical protein